MRASGKDRPCKEQGTISDHPESGSSRIQKPAVATARAEVAGAAAHDYTGESGGHTCVSV